MRSHRRTPKELAPQKSASQRIIMVARRHYLSTGFRRVTMDDLAEELGMSKKTLYTCFASKATLLKAVLMNKFNEIETDLRLITSDSGDVQASLHRLLACIQRHTEEIQ